MTDELPDLPSLRMHEPPPGGLAALRDRLAAPRRARWWWLAVPALAGVAVLAIVLAPRGASPASSPPAAVLHDRTVGPTFYWVASTPGPTAARRAAISIADAPTVTTYAAR